MRRVATIWTLLALVATLASGCPARRAATPPGPSPEVLDARSPTADPRVFLDHLLTLARAGDEEGWALQLSAPRRARGPAYAARHLAAWRPELLRLARDPSGSPVAAVGAAQPPSAPGQVRLERRGDGPQAPLVLVVGTERLMRLRWERGALKIDEN